MQVKDFIIPYRRTKSVFKIYTLGDIHSGIIHCAEDKIKAKVEQIASEKYSYWLGMGDYGDFITPNDKRFDPSQRAIASWVEPDDIAEHQRKWIAKLFHPIRKKGIGMLYGNHEEDMRIHHHVNVQQHICDDLEVSNLGFSCFIRLFFKRENSAESHLIKGAFTHGSGWAITKGAKLNKLRRFMDDFEARMYGYAHMHDIIVDKKPYLTVDARGRIKQVEAVGAVTGSWFRTYTQGIIASYGEKRAYPPTVIGCPVYTIDVEKDTIEVT